MKLEARIAREWRFISGLRRTLKWVGPIAGESNTLVCDDWEAAVDRFRDRPAIKFEGRTMTYVEMDALANRYAHWAKDQSITRGSTVAIFLPNRIEYLAIWLGLTKVGIQASLINSNLTGQALAHCLNVSGAFHAIVDEETSMALDVAKPLLDRHVQHWTLGPVGTDHRDLAKAMKSCSQLRPDRETARGDIRAKDTAFYIFTSGTTGMPKAARITHMRAQLYMRGFAGATGARETDRIYVTLPLYHATGGLCAVGAALLTGGSVVLRRKFSASQFWDELEAERCTMFVYIGELCRYLVNIPREDIRPAGALRLAFGNGLRLDVWHELRARFGVPDILEFYGSTEGNVSFFNFDGKPGAIGRIPKWLRGRIKARLVQYDVETGLPVRSPEGLCIECGPGQVGECLGEIGPDPRSSYSGYADKTASEQKILRDVFERGDAWFRTGDLMKTDTEGYFYFVDRIGDTFRWKGENVSTSEVEGCIARFPGVDEVTVYGVPVGKADGKAGMAAITAGPGFDIAELGDFLDQELPAYARPLFVRLLSEIETTGTFKYRKQDLIEDGFNPAVVTDKLFYRPPGRPFAKITKTSYARIVSSGGRYDPSASPAKIETNPST